MKAYIDLINYVLQDGQLETNRTDTRTISVTGAVIQFDLAKGFPATTIKSLARKPVIGELLWFISGSTNVDKLREITFGKNSTKKTIWDDNYNKQAIDLGYDNGYLGPVYGHQWRNFNGVDQLADAIEQIKTNPTSRRIIVSAWNPTQIDKMALPPCHVLFRFAVKQGRLNLTWYQRSVDVGLGLPFNIASYAALLMIVAKITGYEAGILTGMLDDVHIYENHLPVINEFIKNEPLELCKLEFPDISSLDDLSKLSVDDFKFVDYKNHGNYKMDMVV